MNNQYLGSQRRQSDEIMKKLNDLKSQFNMRVESSPNNLADYLPNQRFNSHYQNPETQNSKANLQSYRQSLQKKLQRLFKQQKKIFHQNQNYPISANESINNFQKYLRHDNKDAFTIEKMQQKIKQLEKKYLSSNPISEQRSKKKQKIDKLTEAKFKKSKSIKQCQFQQQSQQLKKKTKSIYEKQKMPRQRSPKKLRIQQKSQKRLLTQIGFLKRQIKQIRQSNVEITNKIEHKEHERKNRKQRSKYLLGCILAKLIQIQQQIRRRQRTEQNASNKKSEQNNRRYTTDERESLKLQNSSLIRQIQQLNRQLKRQTSQRKLAYERNRIIQSQLVRSYKI